MDYPSLKEMVIRYINDDPRITLTGEEIRERIQRAYNDGEIDGHEYDDCMQYLDD